MKIDELIAIKTFRVFIQEWIKTLPAEQATHLLVMVTHATKFNITYENFVMVLSSELYDYIENVPMEHKEAINSSLKTKFQNTRKKYTKQPINE